MDRVFVNCYNETFEANVFVRTSNNVKNYTVIENFVKNKFKPIKREEIDFKLVEREPIGSEFDDLYYEDTIREDVKNYDTFYMEQDLGDVDGLRSLIAFQVNEVEIDGKEMFHLVMIDLVKKFKVETLEDKEVKHIGEIKEHDCFITFALYLMYIAPELGYRRGVEDFRHFIETVTPFYVLEDVIGQLNNVVKFRKDLMNDLFLI